MSEHVCSHCGCIATHEINSSKFGQRWFCDNHAPMAAETMAGKELMWPPSPHFEQPEPEPDDTEDDTS